MPANKSLAGLWVPSNAPDPGPWTPANMVSYAEGMLPWRQIVFGPYVFPLSTQEKTRSSKLPLDRIKIPFNYGEWVNPFSSRGAREVEVTAMLGSGMVGGASDPQLILNGDDLEAERVFLESMQDQGTQPLYTRPDRYLNAYLSEFTHALMDGTSFRAADWTLKFVAADPRYYAAPYAAADGFIGQHSKSGGSGLGGLFTTTVAHLGNTFAWPTIIITATAGGLGMPFIEITAGTGGTPPLTSVVFSGLNGGNAMSSGDVLVIQCDPRPETRQHFVALLYRGGLGNQPENAIKYISPQWDFANTRNASSFFPYIDGSNDQGQKDFNNQTFNVGHATGSGGAYTFVLGGNFHWELDWVDTWV